MGRGRKGLIDQSIKKDRNHVFYNQIPFIIIQGDPIRSPVDPVFLPACVIDQLKQMDPKAVAELLLKWTVRKKKYGLVHKPAQLVTVANTH